MVKFPFKFPPIAANEVRANILYTGLCHSDVMTVREHWGPAMFPIAPGHEIIGEVSLVGSDVKDFKKGDLVAFELFVILVVNADIVRKIEKNYAEMLKNIILMVTIGVVMLLLYNNQLLISSIYLLISKLKKVLLFFVLVSLLIIL